MGTETKTQLEEYVNSLGLTYMATFQPKPQPADKVKNPQLHWLISLSKGKRTLETPYSQGMGHVQGYRQNFKTPYDKRVAEEQYRYTCETGKLSYYSESAGNWYPSNKMQPTPKLLDVLYCLVMDASVLDYSSYEEWAPELGYDIDSRKGEQVYKDCIKQSLALKNLIGHEALEKLRELYQDY